MAKQNGRQLETVLREANPATELEALAALCEESVRGLGRAGYSAAQVDVWAEWPRDRSAFRDCVSRGTVLVAECGRTLQGFGQLNPADHLALLYVHPQWARQGIGTRLCRSLEKLARAAGARWLSTHASALSRPLFERLGFEVVREEQVQRGPVVFQRWEMRKGLV